MQNKIEYRAFNKVNGHYQLSGNVTMPEYFKAICKANNISPNTVNGLDTLNNNIIKI